jgi:PHD/YefM family antitoxin component YafN of YafNO toxin-antitoxin module
MLEYHSIDQSEEDAMTRTTTATEARVHFGDVLGSVIQRGGKPQRVILSVEEYEQLPNERLRVCKDQEENYMGSRHALSVTIQAGTRRSTDARHCSTDQRRT